MMQLLNKALAGSLVVLLCISGINAIPFADIDVHSIISARRVAYIAVMNLLLVSALVSHRTIDRRFSLCCGLLILIAVANAAIRQEMLDAYGYFVLSMSFVWLFVTYVSAEHFPLDRFLSMLRAGVLLLDAFFVATLAGCLAKDPYVVSLVLTGFNGNRVNFSIWLSQIIFLNLFLIWREKKHFLYGLAVCSPILAVQVFSGGRIGVLCSLALLVYFSFRRSPSKTVRVGALVWILALTWGAGNYPLVSQRLEQIAAETTGSYSGHMIRTEVLKGSMLGDSSIFRELDGLRGTENVVQYIDRLSAHRVRITLNALASLDAVSLVVGKGAGRFDVEADNAKWMVHNVFLKTLGEFGIGALLLLLALILLPFGKKYQMRGRDYGLHFLVIIIGGMAGLLQPNIFVTGLSDCMVVWLCYALIMRRFTFQNEPPSSMNSSSRSALHN